jgi:hypothetical protein
MKVMAAITKPTNHRSIRWEKGRLETLLMISFLNNAMDLSQDNGSAGTARDRPSWRRALGGK